MPDSAKAFAHDDCQTSDHPADGAAGRAGGTWDLHPPAARTHRGAQPVRGGIAHRGPGDAGESLEELRRAAREPAQPHAGHDRRATRCRPPAVRRRRTGRQPPHPRVRGRPGPRRQGPPAAQRVSDAEPGMDRRREADHVAGRSRPWCGSAGAFQRQHRRPRPASQQGVQRMDRGRPGSRDGRGTRIDRGRRTVSAEHARGQRGGLAPGQPAGLS